MKSPSAVKLLLLLVLFFQIGCIPPSSFPKSGNTPLSGREVGPASFSPDDNEIIFSMSDKDEKTSHLYKSGINGKGLIPLTSGTSFSFGPVFSPDGKTIVYSCMTDGKQGDLWLMNADGSDARAITAGSEQDFGPIFSQDGGKIFFIRAQYLGSGSPLSSPAWHGMDIFSVHLDGTDLKKITSFNAYRIGFLSMSQDGQNILAAISDDESPYGIWIIPILDPHKKEPVQPDLIDYQAKFLFFKLKPDYTELYSPDFSPGGNELIFSWRGASGIKNIYKMDLSSRRTRKITNLKRSVFYPHFSTDGSKIVFQTIDYARKGPFKSIEEPSLWVINTDGTELKKIDFK